jgi:PhnB protein
MKENEQTTSTFFAPMLYLKVVAPAIEFYKKAFGAIELNRWSNDDGTVHVAELSINNAIFHLHEESSGNNELSPETLGGTCNVIGLFVNDPHSFVEKAVEAGGTLVHEVQDYEYDYRQGSLNDPFGHHWLIEKKLELQS